MTSERSGPQAVRGPGGGRKEAQDVPYLKEAADVVRLLGICDKNVALYPFHGRVAQEALRSLHSALAAFLERAGVLSLQVFQATLEYDQEELYREEDRGRSLAFRLHKDGVREITFLPGLEEKELADFIVCLRDARGADEDDDDFTTLFWEKDYSHIQILVAEDLSLKEELPEVPRGQTIASTEAVEKFRIPAEEKERLEEILEKRRADEGDSRFEISPEELEAIREMVHHEQAYFPLFDFVDILLELMVRNPDPEAFSRSVHMIRAILASIIQDHDFARGAYLMDKFSKEAHPGLTADHRRQIQEMLASFTDKETLQTLETFLAENGKLPRSHAVFDFMKTFPRSAARHFCRFLSLRSHLQSITEVLVQVGMGGSEAFVRELDNPDPIVARAMVSVVLRTEKNQALEKIARALKHPDASVRVLAARTLVEEGDRNLGGVILPLLEEEDRQLLFLALQFFSRVRFPEAFGPLLSLSESRRFQLLDAKRQRLCYKALLSSAGARGVDFICDRVLRWRFCFTTASLLKKAAALAALGTVTLEKAEATLTRFARLKKSPLASTARLALNSLHRAREQAEKAGAESQPVEV